MSVLIKGMEMPTSCYECPIGDSVRCALMPGVPAWWVEYDQRVIEKRLHSHCPLVPIPPHGRLIDADALIQNDKINSYDAVFAVAEAPTIIEGDEE